MILGVGAITFIYYKKIFAPMRQFIKKLGDLEEEKRIHDIEDQQILELEMASAEFREMMQQIQSLKIAIYEKELMQSQTELEYVQEQINSHFYLNCISVIHEMAGMHHADDIVLMSEKLFDYVRYVVNDSYVLREIKQEIAHIKDYMDIQKMRYEGFFTLK